MEFPFAWASSVVVNFCEIPLLGNPRYTSIELQSAKLNGEFGFIAILHHVSGGLDVLFEASLGLDKDWATKEPAMAHMQVRTISPVVFTGTHCNVTANTVDVRAEFRDSFEDIIVLRVKHSFKRSSEQFFTPAPPHKSTTPHCLRFMVMDIFHLMPRNSQISVAVNNKPQNIAYFILPAFIAPYTATRAGGDFLLAGLTLNSEPENNRLNTNFETNSLSIVEQNHWFEMSGLPTVDELAKVKHGDSISGDFQVLSAIGVLATGQYLLECAGNEFKLSLDRVRQDWFPGWRSPTRLMMRLARNRNRRHQKVGWSSVSKLQGDGSWQHVGGWTVKKDK